MQELPAGPRAQDRPADATLRAHTRATRRFPGTGHDGPAWSGTEVLAATIWRVSSEHKFKTKQNFQLS